MKRSLEEWEQLAKEQPKKYSVKDGLVLDLQAKGGAKIVANFNQHHLVPLTPERSRELHAIRRARKLRDQTRGRIDAVREYIQEQNLGIEIPAPDDLTEEQLIQAEGSADYLLSKLFTSAFMRAAKDSKNFRGLSEGYHKVMGIIEESPQPQAPAPVFIAPPEVMLKMLELLDRHDQHRQDSERREVIDV